MPVVRPRFLSEEIDSNNAEGSDAFMLNANALGIDSSKIVRELFMLSYKEAESSFILYKYEYSEKSFNNKIKLLLKHYDEKLLDKKELKILDLINLVLHYKNIYLQMNTSDRFYNSTKDYWVKIFEKEGLEEYKIFYILYLMLLNHMIINQVRDNGGLKTLVLYQKQLSITSLMIKISSHFYNVLEHKEDLIE